MWQPQRLSGASSLHRSNVPGLQSKMLTDKRAGIMGAGIITQAKATEYTNIMFGLVSF